MISLSNNLYLLETKQLSDIPPEKRTLNNLPKYSDGKPKIKFYEWLKIKKPEKFANMFQGSRGTSWGKGCDGKYYGWSHRAIYGFGVGDTVKKNTIGNWKGEEWVIKSEEDAARMAHKFAAGVS